MTILLTATGLDMVISYSAVVACIANMGPALGDAGVNFASLNDTAKVILSFAMLIGRLDIYSPGFVFAGFLEGLSRAARASRPWVISI